MNVRLLLALEESLMIKVGQKESPRMVLAAWLVHPVEASIVELDISVSASAIWFVNDTSIPLHVLSVVVLGS